MHQLCEARHELLVGVLELCVVIFHGRNLRVQVGPGLVQPHLAFHDVTEHGRVCLCELLRREALLDRLDAPILLHDVAREIL